ncbi:ureidoglycolate dehydrogenase [Escherichia coli]|nr:ureidoglycolate dehydrogenase [Escherichia coli]
MKISRETLHQLIENKLCQAGLKREHAATVAEVLVYADARGIHSHGAVRVEYYAERISKGGTNREPEFRLEETGPCSAILHADNAAGQVAAKMGMEHAIKTAQQNGVAVVGISPDGSQRRNLLFCAAGSPRRIDWYFAVPVRSNGGAVWRRGNLLRH